MKKIGKLKLKDIVNDPLDPQSLSKILGGVEIMPINYGCFNFVCGDIKGTDGHEECTSKKCNNVACLNGVNDV